MNDSCPNTWPRVFAKTVVAREKPSRTQYSEEDRMTPQAPLACFSSSCTRARRHSLHKWHTSLVGSPRNLSSAKAALREQQTFEPLLIILERRLSINAKMTSRRQQEIKPGNRQTCQDSHAGHPLPQQRRPPSQGNTRTPYSLARRHVQTRKEKPLSPQPCSIDDPSFHLAFFTHNVVSVMPFVVHTLRQLVTL